jgi:lysophospholipase L1-like esterase
MNGRTTVFEDPLEAGRSGLAACIPIMASHQPLDFVIIMLGTNDTKTRFHVSAGEIALGLSRLVKTIQLGNYEKASLQLPIGIIAPPIIQEAYAEEVFRGAQEKSKLLASYYEEIAQDLGCYFFNAATVVQTSIIDGVHLEGEAHRNLGLAVAQWVMNI